jgi:hypothetical protein
MPMWMPCLSQWCRLSIGDDGGTPPAPVKGTPEQSGSGAVGKKFHVSTDIHYQYRQKRPPHLPCGERTAGGSMCNWSEIIGR